MLARGKGAAPSRLLTLDARVCQLNVSRRSQSKECEKGPKLDLAVTAARGLGGIEALLAEDARPAKR